jgi:hypothetical protein
MMAKRSLLYLFFWIFFGCFLVTANAENTLNMKAIPTDMGLPVQVSTGVNFLKIDSVSENDGTFEGVFDINLVWVDQRLKFDKSTAPMGFIAYRNEEASQKLDQIWRPNADIENIVGEPSSEIKDIRIYPDGTVNYLRRIKGKFSTDFDLSSFPYDKQKLEVAIISRAEPSNRVVFDFNEGDLKYSNSSVIPDLTGWDFNRVTLSRDSIEGLRGTKYPRLIASLHITRQPFGPSATILMPLLSCLLIPFLVLWLNTLNHEEKEGFGMSNTEIAAFPMGGLFAVVALNFTVNTTYVALGQVDNPVMELFGLNYLLVAFSILVSIFLYRYYVVRRLYGTYVQNEFFHVLCWATPVLSLGVSAAIIAQAMVS